MLSILLTITLILCLLQATVFSEDFLRRQIDKSGYVSYAMGDLIDALSFQAEPVGFSKDVIRSAITGDMLKADIYREISFIYEDTDKTINAETMKKNIENALLTVINASGNINDETGLTDARKNDLASFSEKAAPIYIGAVSIPFAGEIHDTLKIMKDANITGIAGFGQIALACALILLFGAKHKLSRRRRAGYIMNAVTGAVLILGIPTAYLYFNGWLELIPISDKPLYALTVRYLSSVIQIIWIFIGIMAVIWLCGMLYRRAYMAAVKDGRRFKLITRI